MKKLDGRTRRKKEILRHYKQALDAVKSVRFFEQDLKHTTPWFIDVLCERRGELQMYLKEQGIGTRAMYPPINRQNAYRRSGSCPVSELVGEKGLWLPSSSHLTEEQIGRVCDAIKQFYQ